MFGSEVLELGAGLALFFLLVSLLCSAVRELLEAVLKSRARDLERGLRMLLDDPWGSRMMPALLGHGLISSLSTGSYNPARLTKALGTGVWHLPVGQRASFPSYIPARLFAAALLDVVVRGLDSSPGIASSTCMTVGDLRDAVQAFPIAKIRRVLLCALDAGGNDLDRVRGEIETWFNGSMDRVSGWYKRRTQLILFGLGLGVAVLLNLDALTIASRLNQDEGLRKAALAQVEAVPHDGTSKAGSHRIEEARAALTSIGYPYGWVWAKGTLAAQPTMLPFPGPQLCPAFDVARHRCGDGPSLGLASGIGILIGWLVTALAVSLGAPFWFDLLNRIMIVRSTIKPRQESSDTASIQASHDPAPIAGLANRREAGGGSCPSTWCNLGCGPGPSSSGGFGFNL